MTGLPNLPIAAIESTPNPSRGPGPVAEHRLVLEAWGDLIDPRDYLRDDPDYAYGGTTFVPDRIENRERGEDYPIFRNEHDLATIRAVGDFFAKRSAGGAGPLSTLGNYVFSKGFVVTAQAAENVGNVPEELLVEVRKALNAFTEFNSFAGLFDRELDNRSRRHGEALATLAPTPCGNVRATFREPSQLTEPTARTRQLEDWIADTGLADCSGFVSSWSFGVHTPEGRHNEPLGYHFVWNASGTNWDYLPASRVLHFKRNVDACVKRGVSDFYACSEFLAHSEKLLRNTAMGSATQAAIAYIKEYAEGVTRDQAVRQQQDKATRTGQVPTVGGSTRTLYQRRFEPNTVLEVSAGQKYTSGPLGSERAPRFIEVIQAALRYVGVRWNMPEYMISGDASNANLASALVAEAPFVKAREADQLVYSNAFRELFWKVLRIRFDAGAFSTWVGSFAELQSLIYLKIDPPSVATRDRQKEITADKILVDAGAMSVATMAQRDGLDHKAEVDAGAAPTAFSTPGLPSEIPSTIGRTVEPKAEPSKPADASLNGAQITSAVEVLAGIRTGNVADLAALELLSAVGIDRGRANSMIAATKKLPTPSTEQPSNATASESVEDQLRKICTEFRYP